MQYFIIFIFLKDLNYIYILYNEGIHTIAQLWERNRIQNLNQTNRVRSFHSQLLCTLHE